MMPGNPVPEETQDDERPSVASRLTLWLVIISLGALLLPLYLLSGAIKEHASPMETEIAQLEATLSSTPPPVPQEEELKATLLSARQNSGALGGFNPTLAAGHVNWPGVMSILGSYDQTQIALTGVVEADHQITLTGQAVDENAVVSYADQLKQSDYFSRVIVQMISMSPTPTPAPTPMPETASMTAEFSILVELKTSEL